MKRRIKYVLLGALLAGGVVCWVLQKRHAVELQQSIADLRRSRQSMIANNTAKKDIAAATDEPNRAKIEKARMEVAELEAAWTRMSEAAPRIRDNDAPFTANHDPEKGPVRLKYFRNVGQATPSAAFQTLIWALTNNEADMLPALLGLSPTSHAKLREMAARVPPAGQNRFNPPEKILGLLLELEFLKEDGFVIGSATEPNASGQATLMVRRVHQRSTNLMEKKLPFERGPAGWQLTVTDAMVDAIPSAIESASMYVAPRE